MTEFVGNPWPATYPGAKTERAKVLVEAAKLVEGARDVEYGPPAVNMGLAAKLKIIFHAGAVREIGGAEREAIDMAITKLARIATGAPKRDTYLDAAAYLAIAWENSQVAPVDSSSE